MAVNTHDIDYLLDGVLDPDALEELPVLDVGPYLDGDPDALEPLAAELCKAQTEIGFYSIVNHGVPGAIVDEAYAQLARFFALPEDDKLKVKINEYSHGYVPVRSTVYVSSPVAKNTKKDLNEVLIYGRDRPADHPAIVAGLRYHGQNPWPENLPGFREGMTAYFDAMEALAYRMLPVYARALDMPAEYFTPLFKDPLWTTRNGYYPVVDAEVNQFGIAPHRDHGFFTMLPPSPEPGLEVLARTGRWIPVDIPDGNILVNTGEFMNRLTNGRFLATPHRVTPPKHDRYSLAFFFNPTHDVPFEVLPSCIDADNPPRFEAKTIYEYITWYSDTNFLRGRGGQQKEAAAAE